VGSPVVPQDLQRQKNRAWFRLWCSGTPPTHTPVLPCAGHSGCHQEELSGHKCLILGVMKESHSYSGEGGRLASPQDGLVLILDQPLPRSFWKKSPFNSRPGRAEACPWVRRAAHVDARGCVQRPGMRSTSYSCRCGAVALLLLLTNFHPLPSLWL
jgi:hypothetical protein